MHQFRNDTLKHVFFQNFEFVTLAGRLWPEGGILNYNRVIFVIIQLYSGLFTGIFANIREYQCEYFRMFVNIHDELHE